MESTDKRTSTRTDALGGISAAAERLGLTASKLKMPNAALGAIDRSFANRLQGALGSDALERITKINERTRQAAAGITALSAFNKVAGRIDDQFKAIDAARLNIPEMPRFEERAFNLPEMPIIENPIFETNERLKSIEERFDKMEAIALNGAEIATSLQVSAATFLDKFEAVANDNDKTTKRAVWIGLIAVFVAIVIPLLQSLYTEIYRAPSDAAAMQAAISDIRREMQSVQQTQAMVSNKIAEALAKNGDQTTQALKEIRDLLAQQKHSAPSGAIGP